MENMENIIIIETVAIIKKYRYYNNLLRIIKINIFKFFSTDISTTYKNKMVLHHIKFRDYFYKFVTGNYMYIIPIT